MIIITVTAKRLTQLEQNSQALELAFRFMIETTGW